MLRAWAGSGGGVPSGSLIGDLKKAVAERARDAEITAGHEVFRAGEEKYLWHGNENNLHVVGETVGLIGFGGLAQCVKPLLAPSAAASSLTTRGVRTNT